MAGPRCFKSKNKPIKVASPQLSSGFPAHVHNGGDEFTLAKSSGRQHNQTGREGRCGSLLPWGCSKGEETAKIKTNGANGAHLMHQVEINK